ncbi:pyridoxamine 5'-phosphate oxidase family protein [Gordonia soli]|nr:pyridoxamine 5'-phosphate oxidase family protein [Gordonia soli]
MSLSRAEREQYLAQPKIASLAVEAGPDRAPLVVPIWYQYEVGGQPWILTATESRKLDLIRSAGRFTLAIDDVEPTIRYVSVSGEVDRYEDGTHDDLVEMSARYLPADKVEGYVAFAEKEHGAQTKVYLRPQQWVSADLGNV